MVGGKKPERENVSSSQESKRTRISHFVTTSEIGLIGRSTADSFEIRFIVLYSVATTNNAEFVMSQHQHQRYAECANQQQRLLLRSFFSLNNNTRNCDNQQLRRSRCIHAECVNLCSILLSVAFLWSSLEAAWAPKLRIIAANSIFW